MLRNNKNLPSSFTHLQLHDHVVEFVISTTANKLTHMVFTWKKKKKRQQQKSECYLIHINAEKTGQLKPIKRKGNNLK